MLHRKNAPRISITSYGYGRIAVGSKVVVAWNNAIPVFVNGDRKFIVDKAYVLGIVNDD